MSGGPLLPSSMNLGGASGVLTSIPYIPATNTNGAGAMEGIGVVASLAAPAPAVLQFNLPPTIPTGTFKLRWLAMANATSGVRSVQVKWKNQAAGVNLGAATLTTETATSQTWTGSAGTTADSCIENKLTFTSPSLNGNDILTVLATFNPASTDTLAAQSVWQPSVIWE